MKVNLFKCTLGVRVSSNLDKLSIPLLNHIEIITYWNNLNNSVHQMKSL